MLLFNCAANLKVTIAAVVLLCACVVTISGASRTQTRDNVKPRGRHVTARERDSTGDVQPPPSSHSGFCELEISCKGSAPSSHSSADELLFDASLANQSLPVRLPIRGPRGPPGPPGERGERGIDGLPGLPGSPGGSLGADRKVAFFVGLTENFGPVTEHTDIVFDRIITNVGSAYNQETGRFTAPFNGVYQFNVVISAQGRQKAAVMVLKNGEMVATVWAESIPYWSTASNVAVLSLDRGDQVWLLLLSRASYLHGYMYTTFSGAIAFTL